MMHGGCFAPLPNAKPCYAVSVVAAPFTPIAVALRMQMHCMTMGPVICGNAVWVYAPYVFIQRSLV
jgi:hypothetical protein